MPHRSIFLNVLVFSINVECNSENLYYPLAKVFKKVAQKSKIQVLLSKICVNVYEEWVAKLHLLGSFSWFLRQCNRSVKRS